MIDKIRQVFHDELEICDIRKLATFEYEIDTIGYNYYYGGYKLPMGTFSLMHEYGLNNIRIMKSKRVSKFESYCLTIRFTVNVEELDDRLQRDKEWRIRWEQLNQQRNTS